MTENSYEYRLIERITSEMNTLLNPVHVLAVGLNMRDIETLESALKVLEALKIDNEWSEKYELLGG